MKDQITATETFENNDKWADITTRKDAYNRTYYMVHMGYIYTNPKPVHRGDPISGISTGNDRSYAREVARKFIARRD